MFNFLIIILMLILFTCILMLYKYINFLMYYFNDELQILKKNINISSSIDTIKEPETNYYCPEIFKSKTNECIQDDITGTYKCAFKKWGLAFDSPPGCCKNNCNNSQNINNNINTNNSNNSDNISNNSDNISNNSDNIIEPFDNKYWCYKSNNKCIEKKYNPLNTGEKSCGTNILNNQLSKIYNTEKECINDYNDCNNLDINTCLSKNNCGWCANNNGGVCLSGNPSEPNDMNAKCNPYMYGEIK